MEYKIDSKFHSWSMINIPCIQLDMNLIYIYSEEWKKCKIPAELSWDGR